jgi:hypothetical protein
LTDDKKELRNAGTTTVTQDAPQTDLDMDLLTAEEERVVRMRHGLAEDDDYQPKFGLGASDDTLAQLANLEMFLVEKFARTAELDGAFDGARVDVEAKHMIIQALQERDD